MSEVLKKFGLISLAVVIIVTVTCFVIRNSSQLSGNATLSDKQKQVIITGAPATLTADTAVASHNVVATQSVDLDKQEDTHVSAVTGKTAGGASVPSVPVTIQNQPAPSVISQDQSVAQQVLHGLTPEEQRRANEEANSFVLPVMQEASPDDEGGPVTGATGAIRSTPEQVTAERAQGRAVKKVLLNKIGLARINAERAQKGLAPLVAGRDVQVAPIGRDSVMGPAREVKRADRTGGAMDVAGGGGDLGAGDVVVAPANGDVRVAGALPAEVNNSTLQYFPPIGNQGSVNSCVGWAEIYYNLTHEIAIQRDWNAKTGGSLYRMAPMFTYNFQNGGANVGTEFGSHYYIAWRNGVVRQSEKSSSSDYTSWLSNNPDAYKRAFSTRTDRYSFLGDLDTPSGLQVLKEHLNNGHVASYGTYINSWQYKTTGNDPGTSADDAYVGKSIAYKVSGTQGSHAMTVVGYNDDLWCDIDGDGVVDANEKGALRVANSWGTDWKESGYCWVAYQALVTRNSGATYEGIFFDDSGGITTLTAVPYEPKLVAKVTYNHNKRNQLWGRLGVSATNTTTPTTTLHSGIVDYQGGAKAFSGAAPAYQDFSYYLDFTAGLPALGQAQRYYLVTTDSGASDGTATIKAFDLYYIVGGVAYYMASASGLPATVNGSTDNRYIEWTYAEPTTVSVSLTDGTASETGPDAGSWTVTRTGSTTNSLDVNFALSGTASNGADYTVSSSGTVTIPVGQASATITLTPVDDSVADEPVETVTLTLTAGTGDVMVDPDGYAVNILDNDYVVPVVTNQSATALSTTSASVSGMVLSGRDVQAWICWGTMDGGTNSMGDWEHVETMGSVTQNVAFIKTITGLATNASYWYRCIATNVAGKGWASVAKSFSGAPGGGGGVISNMAPTGISSMSAMFNASYAAPGTNYAVYVYYGTSDAGTNPALWESSAYVGSWTNVASASIGYPADGLVGGQQYYYTFRASNTESTSWASPSWSIVMAGKSDTCKLTVDSLYGTAVPDGITPRLSNSVVNVSIIDSPVLVGSNLYVCTGWAGTGSATSGSGMSTSFRITNDTTVSWIWATNTVTLYNVVFDPGTNGVHTGGGALTQLVAEGWAAVAPEITPDAGCVFDGWSAAFDSVNSDMTIQAQYSVIQYTLTYLAGANGSISGTATQTVAYGNDGAFVTAVPDSGYHFVNWSDTSDLNPRGDANITADLTLMANFALNIPPVVGNGSGATSVSVTSAMLSGVLVTGQTANAWICWGTTDGGISSTSVWEHVVSIGAVTDNVAFSNLVTGLATNKTYVYRCYAENPYGSDWSDTVISFSGQPAVSLWTPAELTLAAWYDAVDTNTITASSGAVSQWADKSGNSLHLGQGTATNRPATGATINSLNALDFTGDLMTTASNPFGTTVSNAFVITVHKVDSLQNGVLFSLTGTQANGNRWNGYAPWGDGNMYFDCGGVSAPNRISTNYNVSAGNVVLSSFYCSTADNVQQVYNNGSLLVGDSSGQAVNTVSNRICVGGADGGYQDTTLGEFIIIKGAVNAATRQKLEGYLAHKWGLAANLPVGHPYKSSPPGGGVIAALAPTGISETAATFNASLVAPATNYVVAVHWGTTDGGSNAGAWATSTTVGSWTNVASTNISYLVSGLAPGQTYYYTFSASNAGTNVWAEPRWQFAVPGLSQTPVINTAGGATDISYTSAVLNGSLSSTGVAETTVWCYWNPDSDPGPTTTGWAYSRSFGVAEGLRSYTNDTSVTAPLLQSTVYYYRYCAINSYGTNWSAPRSFETLHVNVAPVVTAGTSQTLLLSGSTPWTPAQIACAAWYDAADASTITASSGAVSQWSDKSGNGKHLAQNTAANRPTTGSRTLNGLNVIDFDGTSDQLTNSVFSVNTLNVSIFSVQQHDVTNVQYMTAWAIARATPAEGQLLHASSGSYFSLGNRLPENNAVFYQENTKVECLSYVKTGDMSQQAWTNGVVIGQNNTAVTTYDTQNLALGSRFSANYLNGMISEFIVIPGAVSTSDRQKLEGYLAHKWGLTNSLPAGHPYKSVAPGTGTAVANLAGSASDADSDPLTTTWSVVSPTNSGVTFGNAAVTNTTATFTSVGSYVLSLTASDTFTQTVSQVTITVVTNLSQQITHTITVAAPSKGTISPSGAVIVAEGCSTNFVISPDNHYSITAVYTNGIAVTIANPAGFTYIWSNVRASGTLAALFQRARTITNSVPTEWLAATVPASTNNYETAAVADPDNDGYTTAQEYWSGTDPLNAGSYLKLDSIELTGTNALLKWSHSRVDTGIPPITIQVRSNLVSGTWGDIGTQTPTNGVNTWTLGSSVQGFYRLTVTNAP